MDRQPSTIARELKRNTGSKIGYRPAYAQVQASARGWSGPRLEREDDLRETVLDRLAAGRSPEQVAGRPALDAGHRVISHESIYRFVYARLKRTNDRRWRHYLPRAKYKRGWRSRGGGWPRIAGRRSIHDRPPGIERQSTGGPLGSRRHAVLSFGPGHPRRPRTTASPLPCASPASRPIPSPTRSPGCCDRCRRNCAAPSPSTILS